MEHSKIISYCTKQYNKDKKTQLVKKIIPMVKIYLAISTSKENTLIEIEWYHKISTKSTSDMESGGVTTIENSRDQ
jgi:hypothetical protein